MTGVVMQPWLTHLLAIENLEERMLVFDISLHSRAVHVEHSI